MASEELHARPPLRRSALVPVVLLVCGFLVVVHHDVIAPQKEQQFVELARAFLAGQTFFLEQPGSTWGDTALYEGRHYWPLGPLPAILLAPFVAVLGSAMKQGYLVALLVAASAFLLVRIARRITGDLTVALWLACGYLFSTAFIYLAITPWSWYYAQVVAGTFLLLALAEFFSARRWWLIGVCLGLATMARVNTLCAGVFFGLFILLSDDDLREKSRKVIRLTLPVALCGVALLAYNYARFDQWLEFGYRYQLLENAPAVNRQFGLWSFIHFPANAYYLLFKGPVAVFFPGSRVMAPPYIQPDIWGMSIVFTSPILLWGLRSAFADRVARLSLLASGVTLFLLLGYYGIGVRQYGYRYAIDFYPFLFVLLCLESKDRFTMPMRATIVISFLLNFYLVRMV